jgi:hypothetical protein
MRNASSITFVLVRLVRYNHMDVVGDALVMPTSTERNGLGLSLGLGPELHLVDRLVILPTISNPDDDKVKGNPNNLE